MLQKLNVILIPLLAFSTRLVIYGASIGDALCFIALCAVYGLTKYLEAKKQADVSEDLRQEINDIKSAIGSLKLVKTYGR